MSEVFRIKPLKWKRNFNDHQQAYESNAAHGSYLVVRYRSYCEDHENCEIESHHTWGPWKWEYSFCEYYNEDSTECASVKEGKAAAEQYWQEYIKAALVAASSETKGE